MVTKSTIQSFFFLLLTLCTALPLGAQVKSKSDLAKQLLQSKSAAERPAAADLAGMVVSSETYSQKSGVTHVYFQQQVDGIPVYNAILNAHVTRDNELLHFSSRFVPEARNKAAAASPTLSPEQAVEAAAKALGYPFNEKLVVKTLKGGTTQAVIFEKGSLSLEDIPVQLVWQPVEDTLSKNNGPALRLAWDLNIYEIGAQNWWSVRMDAQTGEMLEKENRVLSCNFGHSDGSACSHSHDDEPALENTFGTSSTSSLAENMVMGGSYNVFPMPVESPNYGGRSIVTDPAFPNASPFGWHDTDGVAGAEYTITRGNNVWAGLDRVAPNGIDPGGSPDGGPSLDFNFPLDVNGSPLDNQPAAVANLFFWNNLCHDVWYQYGFDEASGNFQANNYGNGGVGGDFVLAEAQDNSGTCNANFATTAEGTPPRMQMLLCGNRDSDLDNVVIAHEYAHGISNRLVGGYNTFCLVGAEQMGEGWSDWVGMMMTIEAGDAGTDSRTIGTWLIGQPANGAGFRVYPYTTDMAVNPDTYDAIKTATGVHRVGSIWNAMIWEVTWALIDQHGFDPDFYSGTGGNNIAMHLITEGMKLTPCSPGFVDARDAILAADVALYGGANRCLIWQAFAKRGLGFSASQGSSNSLTDGTEAFDMPPTLPCLSVSPTTKTVCTNAATLVSVTANANITGGDLTLSLTNPPAGISASFNTNPLPPGASTNTFISAQSSTVPGVYPITISGTNGSGTFTTTVMLTVRETPGATTLIAPADGATDVYIQPTLSWNALPGISQYHLQVSTVPDFTTVIFNSTITATSITLGLSNNTTYYWRVNPINSPCSGPQTATWRFTTDCTAYITPPTPLSPANAATGVSVFPTFDWSDVISDLYTLEVATDAGFTNIVSDVNMLPSQYFHDTPLNPNTQYFWRVRASNLCQSPGLPSATFSFTTNSTAGDCTTTASTEVPVVIPSTVSTTTSRINFPACATVIDVNVQNLSITHTWISALEIELTSPSGTTVMLYDNACSSQDNLLMNFDDEAISPYNGWACPPTGNGTFRPFQPLSAFDGENLAGTWTLTVRTTFDIAGGSLYNWSLDICSLPTGTVVTCYQDSDGDGYGDPAVPQQFCATCQPGWVSDDTDCDDNDSNIKPGATEICNGEDDNCDGIIDFPPVVAYASADVPVVIPTSGTPTVTSTLTISGAAGNITDLNVKDLKIPHTWVGDLKVTLTSPGGTVIQMFDRPGVPATGAGCREDNILATFDDAAALTATDFENTCNPSSSPSTYAISGTYQSISSLSALNGTSPNGTWTLTVQDFENGDGGSIQGWGLEISTTGTLTTYYADSDGDTYGDPANSLEFNCTPVAGSGYVADNTDCDDTDPAINPAATEVCDGVDNNCTGGIDEGNVCCPMGGILYVNDDATGLNNGSSWADAFTDLQSALASTCPGVTEIWVAAGTYKPTTGSDRTISFVLKNGVAIYGGFPGLPGQEGNFGARNLLANTSTLSGDIGAAGNSDNSYTVVTGSGTNNTAILDGFTITGGNANADSAPGNYGSAERSGGGMYTSGGSPTVRNCYFTGNTAANFGGGMCNFSSTNTSPNVTNCVFSGNTAANGGGLCNRNNRSSSVPVITNCTFYGNTAGLGGGILVDSSNTQVKNCIVWGNSSGIVVDPSDVVGITNSIVQGGCPSPATCTSVQNVDPLFISTTDLRLTACSPALDAGSDAANATTTDLDGNNRKFEAIPGGQMIDMGAYEFQSAGATESVVTVSVSPTSTLEDGVGTLNYTFERNCANTGITVNFGVSGTAAYGNDYLATGPGTFGVSSGTVTFATGVSSVQMVIDPTPDNLVEPDETVILTLAAGTGYTIGTANLATGTITNDDASISIAPTDAVKAEGNAGSTAFTFTVTRTGYTLGTATADYAVTGSGVSPASTTDFGGSFPTGTVNFIANETSKVITINVSGDTTVEPDEDFTVTISNPSASHTIGTASASGTIQNDDSATLTLTGGGAANEGNTGTNARTFTATLSAAVQGGFSAAFTTNDGTATTADNDYQDNDGTLTFAGTANEIKTVTVLVNGDFKVENDETFTVAIGALSGTALGGSITTLGSPQTGTITNDDAATVSIAANVSQPEANSPQAFSVTLSNPVDVAVTVLFNTSDGTATTADNDYDAVVNQVVTFAAGTTTAQTVNVTVNDDATIEPDEVFNVNIGSLAASGRNVALGTTARTGTILNDDMATVTLSGGTAKNEGNAGTTSYTFTATLSAAVAGGFTVPYTTNNGTATTADNDYVDNDGTLTFAGTANEMKTITVLVNGDNKVELDETFTVALGAITGAPAGTVTAVGTPQTGTILNDDAATVSIAANVSQPEANSPQVFSVTLSNPVDAAMTVLFNTANGTATTADNDYVAVANQTVTFAAGTTTAQTVNVTVNDDSKVEADETFGVSIGSISASGRNVALGTASRTGTIQNDDSATLTLTGGGAANEGNTGTNARTFTATLSTAVQGGFTVAYTTNDGTATTADNDYQDNDGTLTFAGTANEVKTVTVLLNGDFKVENDETFTVALGALSGTALGGSITTLGSPQTGTILNDEIDFGDAPDSYGTLLAGNGARHAASLALYLGATVDGEADGQPSANADGDGPSDDGVALPASIIAATPATVTVNASAAGMLDAWVDFNGNGNFSDPGEQVFTGQPLVAGDNVLTFTPPGMVFQGTSFARFRLSSAGGLSYTGPAPDGEVEDYAIVLINTQFSINDPSVTEGNAGTANLSFEISRSSNASNCSVDYAITGGTATTADGDYQPLAAGTASFTAGGAFTQTIHVTVNGDVKVELDETVVMTLSNPVNGNILDGNGTGMILNDDAAVITISSPSVTEGNSGTVNLTFDINMSNPSDAGVAFNFGTNDGSATVADGDYQSTGGSHVLTPGQTSKTVTVIVNGDCSIEPDESLTVRLSSLNNNGRAVAFSGNGATLDGTGTILNDDDLPVIGCPASFSQNTDAGLCQATVVLAVPSVSGACGAPSLEFRHRTVDAANVPTGAWSAWFPSAGNTQVFAKGKHEVEWRATDGSGSSTCNLFADILDNEDPVAVCKTTTIFLNAAGTAGITPAMVDNGSSDNCSFSLSLSNTNFTCANVGPNTVTLTATDPSDNAHSCQATVTVVDNLPPTALCKPATVYLNAAGTAMVMASQVNNASTDNCGVANMGVWPNAFTCGNTGPVTVTLTVNDWNGNSANCTATVTVVDNLPPTVACQNISIQLDGNGNANIVPAQVFNAAASSDNCGTVNLVSVFPNQFDCGEIGPNTVTLTANDGNGNTATCTATVTVMEFFTNVTVTATPEDCGMSNGSITVTAEGPGGQIAFSINGGATWQFSGFFNNLPAGNYVVVIQAFGGLGCTNDPVPVTIPSIGSPMTWYKDADGDGYSDGVTQTGCTQPGPEWFLASQLTATWGDCNDYDPLQHPGQTWYRDWDNDGYSDGSTLVQCSKPTGYKHASQLVQAWGDCNDNNPNVHPAAVETCNGIDDNCNGLVDEGLADLTYTGNVVFTTQAQVNAWSGCYTVIDGNLTVKNASVVHINTLKKLRKVTGHVLIELTGLDSLAGLVKLDTVGGNLTVKQNSKLETLSGLDSLGRVGGNLAVFFNLKLSDCCAIHGLLNDPDGIGGSVTIFTNKTGCDNMGQVNAACAPGGSPILAPGGGNSPVVGQADGKGVPQRADVFPNPATDWATVRIYGSFDSGTVKLLDMQGRLLHKQELDAHTFQYRIGLDGLPPGAYLVQVLLDGGQFVQKLVVE